MRWSKRSKSDPGSGKPWMGPLPAAAGCDCQVCRPEESYDPRERSTIDTVLEHGWQVTLVSDEATCLDPEHDHEHHGADRAEEGHDGVDGQDGADGHDGVDGQDGADGHEHPRAPAFAYTVGLGHRCGHPELLMSGLDEGVMHRALNDVARRVMGGRRLAPGDVLEDVLAGVPVVLERVADDALRETVTWSGWFHRREPEALVVVWPSTRGLFAWQPGAPDVLDELQPRGWREPMLHAGGVGTDPEWAFPVPPDSLAFSCTHVVDDGQAVLWAAREADETRGEDWSAHCGAQGHDNDDLRLVHLRTWSARLPACENSAGWRSTRRPREVGSTRPGSGPD